MHLDRGVALRRYQRHAVGGQLGAPGALEGQRLLGQRKALPGVPGGGLEGRHPAHHLVGIDPDDMAQLRVVGQIAARLGLEGLRLQAAFGQPAGHALQEFLVVGEPGADDLLGPLDVLRQHVALGRLFMALQDHEQDEHGQHEQPQHEIGQHPDPTAARTAVVQGGTQERCEFHGERGDGNGRSLYKYPIWQRGAIGVFPNAAAPDTTPSLAAQCFPCHAIRIAADL
jgi:hypothetical protein